MSQTELAQQWDVNKDQGAAEKLERCGIKRKFPAQLITGRWSYVIPLALSLAAVAFIIFDETEATAAVTLLVAVGGFLEWRIAKTEAAFDKFYDRLKMTNERLVSWKNARVFISEEWVEKEPTFEKEMYVCMEVDNLEYVIQKYIRGYMEPTDALRELTCFTSRCRDGKFKATAFKRATRGGYMGDTMVALKNMCVVCPSGCSFRE